MKRDIGLYIDDILESIQKIEKYTQDLTEEQFSRNTQTQDAVLRRLAIIGEAVKNLPADLKEKHKQIPWKQIAGARDIFVHEYFGVGIERVWEAIHQNLPELKTLVEKLLAKESAKNN